MRINISLNVIYLLTLSLKKGNILRLFNFKVQIYGQYTLKTH